MSKPDSIRDSMSQAWQTERLTYRALEDNDVDRKFLQESFFGDPSLFSLWCSREFKPKSKQYITDILAALMKNRLSVIVCLRADPISAVNIGANVEQRENPHVEVNGHTDEQRKGTPTPTPIGLLELTPPRPERDHHRETMLGIAITDAFQGHGYGPEAINWGLDWAFKFGGLHRVGLTCYSFNDRGQKVYERLGFVKEGILREKIYFDRVWHDEIHYGMLESDWEKLRDPEKMK